MGKPSERVGVSSPSGLGQWYPDWGAEERGKLERAYGVELSDESWAALKGRIILYSTFYWHEQAPRAVDLDRRLEALFEASTKFLDAIQISFDPPATSSIEDIERTRIFINTEVSRREMSASDGRGHIAALDARRKDIESGKPPLAHTKIGDIMRQIVDEQWDTLFAVSLRRDQSRKIIADDLAAELSEMGHPDPDGRALEVLEGWRSRGFFPEPTLTDDLRDGMNQLQASISRAKAALDAGDVATVKDGDAWLELIRGLAGWAKKYGYPLKVSSGTDNSKDDGGASAFTHLVNGLQDLMPSAYRRHSSTLVALASGINRALAKSNF